MGDILKHTPNKSIKGFTLVELSIVIVIIGLIVAGITAGQGLVRQAKLRRVLTEKDSYIQAITAFKLEYGALPGDMANASSFWPSCAAPKCNGNGNRYIGYPITNGADGIEALRMWQHLSLSGILGGSYTGVAVSSFETIIGVNAPASAIDGLGWHVRGDLDGAGTIPQLNELFQVYGKNGQSTSYLGLGNLRTVNTFATDGGGFTPVEASALDTKIDDGVPNKGIMFTGLGLNFSPGDCISSLAYVLTDTQKSCQIGFPILK